MGSTLRHELIDFDMVGRLGLAVVVVVLKKRIARCGNQVVSLPHLIEPMTKDCRLVRGQMRPVLHAGQRPIARDTGQVEELAIGAPRRVDPLVALKLR